MATKRQELYPPREMFSSAETNRPTEEIVKNTWKSNDPKDDHYYGSTWKDYFEWRWRISNCSKFYSGEGLEVEEAESVINALALINALVLTIPFGLITSLNYEYFDELQGWVDSCDTDVEWEDIQGNMVFPLYVSVVSSTLALVISTLFYQILPPI